MYQKLAYGSGNLANQMLPAALGIFMYFLMTGFGMDPILAGLLGGVPRLYDAISDPIMGYITDHTRSRWGRRRPYIFGGAIISGILFIVLWQLQPNPGHDPEIDNWNFWYFLVLSLLYITGNTMFSTPLIALGYEMSSDYNERTRLMAISQFIGQFAWMIVPWFWGLVADPDLFATQAEGVQKISILVGVVCIILGLLPAIFCKEEPQQAVASDKDEKITLSGMWDICKDLVRNIVLVSKNSSFLRLCGATFLVFNGYQIISAFSYPIIVFYLFDGDYAAAGNWPVWFSVVSSMATAFMVIPIITWLSNRFGKRQAFVISTVISIFGYILKWWCFNPANPWLMFLPLPFISFGIGGLFTLMMSMTADVCDLDELLHGKPRREGTFGAVYWWMVKLGQALAMMLSGFVLSFVGFDQNAAQQTLDTMTHLRVADIIIPSVTAAIAILCMWGYDLTEQRAAEIKAELERRNG